MFKKIIALSLTLALLAPASTVLATGMEKSQQSVPAIEEILNEYHQNLSGSRPPVFPSALTGKLWKKKLLKPSTMPDMKHTM